MKQENPRTLATTDAEQTDLRPPAIERRPAGAPAPMSFGQRQLWFLQQTAPRSCVYNVSAAARLTGPLNVDALRKSLEEITRRHEILRTRFYLDGDEPVQAAQPEADVDFVSINLERLPRQDRDQAVQRRAEQELAEPFDLARGPMIRYKLFRLSADEHVFLITAHHIVCDGWSVAVLDAEISELYRNFVRRRRPALSPLPFQYADYAIWQRASATGDAWREQLAYWRTHLAGSPSTLDLPADHIRPATPSFQGGVCLTSLNAADLKRLEALGIQRGATLYTTLLAAFATLLSKYTGQHDLVVGAPVAARTLAELEELVGYFVNTLPLRLNWAGDPTFPELTAAVRSVVLDAFSNQEVSLERIVEELHPERSGKFAQPLFQVLFVLQNAPGAPPKLEGLEVERFRIGSSTAKFDLSLRVEAGENGLRIELEYSSDRFERQTAERMLQHYSNLLQEIIADPGRRLSEFQMLFEEERAALLPPDDAAEDAEAARCVHELFEAQVRRAPQATALVSGERRVTYDELDRRANQLAHYLRSLAVGREDLVGIYLERSVEAIVSLLAALKAGAAYVPIDPLVPPERVATLLNDCGAAVLLTDPEGRKRVPLSFLGPVVDLQESWPEIALESENALDNICTPADLAYVIHTSGSTGRPKAVGVEHRQLSAYVRAAAERLGLEDCETFALASPLAVDLGHTMLFPSLCRGGRLHLISEQQARNPDAFASLFERQRTDCLKITPSHLDALLSAAHPERVLPARKLILGGEPLRWDLIRRIKELAPACEVYNHYGPTETTVGVAATRVDDRAPSSDIAPVGPPLANTFFYVLDSLGQLVPPGVCGELYIGGESLARGYLHAAASTAGAFLPNPFSRRQGARLYRTGDRARRLPNGCFEILGRMDRQVKIRGYRVEPGEIESTLLRHPDIQAAAVVVDQSESGERRLVAYVVASAPVEEMRRFLRDELPGYMVPAAIVCIDRIPLNSSGKADYDALSSSTPEVPVDGEQKGQIQQSPIGDLVSGIWSELLGVKEVHPEDDFFEMGGHSLLGVRMMSHIQRAVGVELPLTGVFETPTLGELVRSVEANMPTTAMAAVPNIVSVPRDGELPLSFAQQRLWFLQQLDAESAAYNMTGVLRVEGHLEAPVLEESLTEVVRRHEVLRTTYVKLKGEAAQRIHPPGRVPVTFTDLRSFSPEEREVRSRELMKQEAGQPFDLERGPMLRVHLHKLDENSYRLLLSTHHIAADGWSVGLIFRELSVLYEAFLERKPAILPPLPVQYVDYAAWQRKWLTEDVLENQLQYWRERLLPHPSPLQLPTDRAHPAMQTFPGATVGFDLGAERTAALRDLARRQDVTLFMLLLANFQVLLARYSGQSDIAVGVPVASRNSPSLESLVGFFVSTLVLRADLSGNPDFEEVLRRVRKTALGAFTNQLIPFEYIVEKLQPPRDLGQTPFFQVMFELHRGAPGLPSLPGATLIREPVEKQTAQFDLTLSLVDQPAGLTGSWEYNTDLFDETTIRRMTGHFIRLVDGFLADPAARVSEAPLLSAHETKQLVSDWNHTAVDYPADLGVAARFEQWAAETPQAVAASDGETSITYAALNSQANRIAWRLIAHGVGPDTIVAIIEERGIGLLATILGIYKAGGAYLPIDPHYPLSRQLQVLRESRVHCVVGGTGLLFELKRAAGHGELEVAPEFIDVQRCLEEEKNEHNPPPREIPLSLAYVFYTSGSVGKPKGVLVDRIGLMNSLHSKVADFALTAEDRVAQTASQCFDISVWQLLAPLLAGGCVRFFTDTIIQSPAQLLRDLSRERIAVFETVPALLRVMLDATADDPPPLPALRILMLTGEAVPPQLCRDWFARYPVRILNAYGATECADDSTYFPLDRSPKPEATILPIGVPIANTQVYVLDQAMQLVPVGVCGELYIGGAGVGRGYLHDPAQTADRFVPDPFSGKPGARLYRTGDLGRRLADGNLEFLGRVDHQVKVRGFRVELGEIEETLLQHNKVREAAVLTGGGESLQAYVSSDSPSSLRSGELRSYLKERLPDYMVPSGFLILEDLPHNDNGKIDRKRLAALAQPESPGESAPAPPRTLLEHQVAEIWQETLGKPDIAITDNFFDLGGHSLLALRLMALVEDRLGKSLPLSALFQGPTVEHMAHLLRERQGAGIWSPLVTIQPHGDKPPFFAVHPTGGDVLCYYHLSRLLGNDQPFYGLQARGLDADAAPARTIQEMAADYIKAIRSVRPHGPYVVGGWSFGALVAYEMAQQFRQADEDVPLVAILDMLAPVSPSGMAERIELTQTQWARWFSLLADEFQRVFQADLGVSVEDLEPLEPALQLERFVDLLRNVDFLPPGGGRSIARGFARVHEANCIAAWNYVREAESYPGSVFLIRSREMSLLAESWAVAAHDDDTLGWRQLIRGPLQTADAPGDHNRLLQSPAVSAVAEKLGDALAMAANSRAASGVAGS